MPFCQNCGTKYTEGTKFCQNCGANLASTITPTIPVAGSTPMCAYHSATPATGSCSRCGKATCNVCLVTRSENRLFMGFGSSQICRLCIRYDSATNTAAVVAILVGLVSFVVGAFMSGTILIIGLLAAIALFVLIRNHMRERAQAEILGK